MLAIRQSNKQYGQNAAYVPYVFMGFSFSQEIQNNYV